MPRLIDRLQLEDFALVVVLLASAFVEIAGPGLAPVSGWADPLGALIALLAVSGAIVALATRVPGESRFDLRGGEPARMWMIGPFIGGVGFVGGDALDRLGLPGGEALIGVAFLVALASLLLGERLPVVSPTTRRLLMAPFVLLSAALFHELTSHAVAAFAGTEGFAAWLLAPENVGLSLTAVAILAAVSWIFYAMLIFVPRELADPGGSLRAWAVRFGLFFVSLLAAILVGGALPVLTI